jgi:hypothetical protein
MMTTKTTLLAFFLFFSASILAQKKCYYRTNVKDEVVNLKITKEYLMHEKLQMDNGEFIFFSLSRSEGVPLLIVQIYQRNIYFTKPLCFDYKSRIYFQLNNGENVTLINTGDDACGPLEIDKNSSKHIRKLTGTFAFTKDGYEKLKENGINLMRIKYSREVVDYFVQKELHSQVYQGDFEPEDYFINYSPCIE